MISAQILEKNYQLIPEDAEENCQINSFANVNEMEAQYFHCAEKFREQGRFQLAQTILHSLAIHSEKAEIKAAARKAYRSNLHRFDDYLILSQELNPYDIDYEFNHTQGPVFRAAHAAELREAEEIALVKKICAALEANVAIIEIPRDFSEAVESAECSVAS